MPNKIKRMIQVPEDEYILKILQGRYLRGEEQDWHDVCHRVAKFIANNEEEEKIFYEMMDNKIFIPNSPTLMNAGTPHPMLSACVGGETYIYCIDGLKSIKNISVGDLVLTHKNRFRKVLKVWSNGIKETIKLSHGTNKRKKFDLVCTPDHKILNDSGMWESAIDIISDSKPQLWNTTVSFPVSFDMTTYITNTRKNIVVDNNRIFFINYGEGRKGTYDNQSNSCYASISNDDNMAYIFGLYLANGNIDKNTVRFCINKSDKKHIEFLKQQLYKYTGILPTISMSNHGNWITIKIESIIIKNLFESEFGKGFKYKKIPLWISSASHSYKQQLLHGIMIDGIYLNKTGRLILANPTLVYQSLLLARNIGYHANFTSSCLNKLSSSPTSKMNFGNTTYLENIVKSNGDLVEVFDMEVEEDHSFIAGDFIVHNCFVLPIEDNMESIYETLKNAALIHKSGGGTGYNFSKLRPEGATVRSTKGVASGPVSFMAVYDKSTEAVKQGGARRGANIGVLDVDHKDIEKFITCKRKEGEISNFNISVLVNDKFMESVISPAPSKRYKKIFDLIVDGIYSNGEPGILFYNEMNRHNPTPHLGDITSTNPCGEVELLPNESCNLGSLNLTQFFNPEDHNIDYEKLRVYIRNAVDFLDRVIDKNEYPIPDIDKATKLTRKIGLGIMGWHDLLLMMGISYDDDQAFVIADRLMAFINEEAYNRSLELAEEKGPYPAASNSAAPRNATRTTIAPTGTISIFAGVSSGIEPVFNWVLKRTDSFGEHDILHPIFHEHLLRELKSLGYDGEDISKEFDKIIAHCYETGTIQDIEELTPEFKKLFRNARDIDWRLHVRQQSVFQQHVDNSISKTINMPKDASKEDIRQAIIMAWKMKCKGLTIYREGSREFEVLSLKKQDKKPELPKDMKGVVHIPWQDENGVWRILEKRPKDLPGYTRKVKTGCGSCLLTMNEFNSKPYELPISKPKGGGCIANMTLVTQLVSMAMRWKIPTWDIVKTLRSAKCDIATAQFVKGQADGRSCGDAFGRFIEDLVPDLVKEEEYFKGIVITPVKKEEVIIKHQDNRIKCPNPDCGGFLEMSEGCQTCKSCGYTKCM